MAHDKVYGICESKCFVETMSKDEMIRRMVLISTGEEPKTNFMHYHQGKSDFILPYVETHFATEMSAMFYGCPNLTSVPDLDTHNVTGMALMFQACTRLVSVPDLDMSNATSINNMFDYDYSLTTLRDNPNAPEGSRWQFKDDVSFGDCPLDRTSILKVFNGLQVVEGKTITISETTNNYLSDEDKQIAIDKGWTISVRQ